MKKPGLIPSGKISDAFIQNIDLLPTILDILKIEVPDRKDQGSQLFSVDQKLDNKVDGKSIVPLFESIDSIRDKVFMGCFGIRSSIRVGPYKFIDNRGEKPNELFDLENDPWEKNNIIDRNRKIVDQSKKDLWNFHSMWSRVLAWRDEPINQQ
jgi:arylsulfatase A-like enzyme